MKGWIKTIKNPEKVLFFKPIQSTDEDSKFHALTKTKDNFTMNKNELIAAAAHKTEHRAAQRINSFLVAANQGLKKTVIRSRRKPHRTVDGRSRMVGEQARGQTYVIDASHR